MSTKVIVRETEQKEITYPCLMINKTKDVVLFAIAQENGNYIGVALKHPNLSSCNRGYMNDWDRKQFKPLTGDITISNE